MVDSAWDGTDPADSVLIGDVPGEIRDTKNQINYRISLEHTDMASGEDDANRGGLHRKGAGRAYYESGHAAATKPDEVTAIDSDDDGRLLIDTDDNSLWVYSGSAWEEVALVGGFGGSEVAILDGRSGGQTLSGGTAATDDLTLQANSNVSPSGDYELIIDATQTSAIELNEVPVKSLVLSEDMSGGSTNGTDGGQIKGVKTASEAYDVLTKGVACISATELLSTGGIARCAFGAKEASDSNLTVDLTWAPDFILTWGDYSNGFYPPIIWTSMDATNNKLTTGVYGAGATYGLSVSGNVITWEADTYANKNSLMNWIYYIALKLNVAQQNPS